MSPLHPIQNHIQVLVFTPSGWIRGIIHVPEIQTLFSFLNTSDEILKITDAVLPGTTQPHPFLALQKGATLLVVPQPGQDLGKVEASAVPKERRLVTCLLTLGSIRGRLDVPEARRTSDFLIRSPRFIELNQCHIGPNPYLDPKEAVGEAMPLVYVNASALVGTTEEPPPGLLI